MPESSLKNDTSEEIDEILSSFQFLFNDTTQSALSPVDQPWMCIWLYDSNRLKKNILDEIEIRLNKIFVHVKCFTDIDHVTIYLKSEHLQSFFFIGSGEFAKSLCGIVTQPSKFDDVYAYELDLDPDHSAQNTELWTICNSVDNLFKQISIDIKNMTTVHPTEVEQQLADEKITIDDLFPTFGLFKSTLEEKSFQIFDKDSLKFLLFRLCFEVLTGMDHDDSALEEMCSYFRNYHRMNTAELRKIDQFRKQFHPDLVTNYYSQNSCVYELINQAFRSEDIERIFKCRHYITHLHRYLNEKTDKSEQTFKEQHLYRGQKMPVALVLKLQENKGHFISMNGFLSTSTDCTVGATHACVGGDLDGFVSVIFDMEIDKRKFIKIQCADIKSQSNYKDEAEILFSINTVWKLESVEDNNHYWEIKLILCDNIDAQLTELDQRLTNGFTFLSLGNILRELGDKSNAENFYYRMLDDPNLLNETRGHIYYNLGTLAAEQGRYGDALKNIQEAKECISSNAGSSDFQETTNSLIYSYNKLPSRLRVLNTLGLLYQKKGIYSEASIHFNQALREQGTKLEKAIVHNNFGLLEFDYGNYPQSLEHHTKAINITKRKVSLKVFYKNWKRVSEHMERCNT